MKFVKKIITGALVINLIAAGMSGIASAEDTVDGGRLQEQVKYKITEQGEESDKSDIKLYDTAGEVIGDSADESEGEAEGEIPPPKPVLPTPNPPVPPVHPPVEVPDTDEEVSNEGNGGAGSIDNMHAAGNSGVGADEEYIKEKEDAGDKSQDSCKETGVRGYAPETSDDNMSGLYMTAFFSAGTVLLYILRRRKMGSY